MKNKNIGIDGLEQHPGRQPQPPAPIKEDARHTPGEWDVNKRLRKIQSYLNGTDKQTQFWDACKEAEDALYTVAILQKQVNVLREALRGLIVHLEWREDFVIEDADNGETNCYTVATAALSQTETN